ncbi:MAG: ACP S-malonyltransferase [Massilia sp.]
MSARLLILCPGQGGQHAGMFDLARTDARASRFLDSCQAKVDPDTMFENRVAQPAIVAASLAVWEALRERIEAPSLAAGYSIGELAAYGVAGALAPEDAVALAALRAGLMEAAAQSNPGQAMAAIGGLAPGRASELARHHGFAVAIVTGGDSCIVGGLQDALQALETAIQCAGGRYQRLPVAVASHTPLMASAVAPFASALQAAPFLTQRCPVLAGIDASRVYGKQLAADTLSRQLAQTIEWAGCMDAADEAGITVALELGPGAALSRMLQGRHPHIACRSASDFRSIDGIAAWLEHELG